MGNSSRESGSKRVGITRGKDARTEIFAIGPDRAVWHYSRLSPQWIRLACSNGSLPGSGARDIAVATRPHDGGHEVFIVGADGHVYHRWQIGNSSTWSGDCSSGDRGWTDMGTSGARTSAPHLRTVVAPCANPSRPCAGIGVFFISGEGAIMHNQQIAPAGWSGWSPIPGSDGLAKRIVAIGTPPRPAPGGGAEILAVRGDSMVVHAWREGQTLVWTPWRPLDRE